MSRLAFSILFGAAGAMAFLGLAYMAYEVQEVLSKAGYRLAERLDVSQKLFILPAFGLAFVAVGMFWFVDWVPAVALGVIAMVIASMSETRTNAVCRMERSNGY